MPDHYYARRLDEPSNSSLAQFRRSPLAYRDYVLNGRDKRTPAMALGTVVHMAILEPERFRRSVLALPVARLNGAASRVEWVARCSEAAGVELTVDASLPADELRAAVAEELRTLGRVVCSEDDLATIRAQVASLNLPEHEMARRIIAACEPEVTIRWEEQGVRPKARLDLHSPERLIGADIKSTDDADPQEFRRSVWTYGYHFQEAMYRRAVEAQHGIPARYRDGESAYRFAFILVGKRPPYHWSWVTLDPAMVADADESITRDLGYLATCIAADTWPGRWTTEPVELTNNWRH